MSRCRVEVCEISLLVDSSAFLVRYEARSSAENEEGQKCWRFEKKCEM